MHLQYMLSFYANRSLFIPFRETFHSPAAKNIYLAIYDSELQFPSTVPPQLKQLTSFIDFFITQLTALKEILSP